VRVKSAETWDLKGRPWQVKEVSVPSFDRTFCNCHGFRRQADGRAGPETSAGNAAIAVARPLPPCRDIG
jgi:hypothetical protein